MSISPTQIFVVRHGETEWNSKGLQQGHLDSPLTTSGIEQANAVANGLKGKDSQPASVSPACFVCGGDSFPHNATSEVKFSVLGR